MTTEPIDRWGFPIRDVRVLELIRVHKERNARKHAQRLKQNRIARQPALKKRRELKNKLLIGLRRLSAEQQEGRCYSRPEIAEACNVSVAVILGIERRAMRKLRTLPGLRVGLDKVMKRKFVALDERNQLLRGLFKD